MLRDQRLADGKRHAIESDMATPNTNEAVVMNAVSFITPASSSSTMLGQRIGRISSVESTNALLGLLAAAAAGLWLGGPLHIPTLVGFIGALGMCLFVISRCSVLIVKKHDFRAFPIVIMALLVVTCALARWEFVRLLQS